MAGRKCTRKKTVFSQALGKRVTRCAKFSGTSTRKKGGTRRKASASGGRKGGYFKDSAGRCHAPGGPFAAASKCRGKSRRRRRR